ncbi:quercetin dioxygenase-like cupin family protein [Sphingomonas sp. SORGH_AS 950]|uniref:cupin domain-containing protein n=1 Tax=Sphingomonas sp. SORGH_AS_0950 TaxID=3041792 RepID=UPI002782FFA7|nr:cupin domain-containing protein [Sphingomonas sp. SORGH_AS_0950]MDQ1159033.1 quercetin dioxygenase-like cupin family protein [Sphingomonas sp. SORGH_AS_0950]
MSENETSPIPPAVSRRTLELLPLSTDKRNIVVEEVIIPPGGSAPLHRHPVPGIVYIIEGEVESAYGEEEPKRYSAGETLQDRADLPHTRFRNCKPDRVLRFLAIYALEPDRTYSVRL